MLRRVVLLVALLGGCAGIPEQRYTNPVLDRDFPDPALLRAPDGWIYAYATQMAGPQGILNIQVARSRDLVRWEHLGDALPQKPSWASGTQNFWAPHVVADVSDAGARFVMYYSAEGDGGTDKCLAVAVAAQPQGPFTDKGVPLLCGQGIEHIDPMAFDDPRTGQRLLYWGSGRKPIRGQPLSADRLGFLPGSVAKEIVFPDARSYRTLIEGAWLIHRAGSYYLFYSGDRCCSRNPRYAVMVARSPDALGPFEAFPEPILAAGPEWIAPGHNSVIADDANQDWIVYHAVRPGEDWAPRLMLIDRIVWRDGWPRIAGDRPSSTPQAAPVLAEQPEGPRIR